jgi:hypothetical protein
MKYDFLKICYQEKKKLYWLFEHQMILNKKLNYEVVDPDESYI